jgi:site-specific recombinase XerD
LDFRLHLKAGNLSDYTVRSYVTGVRQLSAFCGDPDLTTVTRGDVERFMKDVLDRNKPATAKTRHSAVRSFYTWLVELKELDASPAALVTAPHVPEPSTDLLSDEQIEAILKTCEGRNRTFTGWRDAAIIRVFNETGVRLGGLWNMKVADLDREAGLIHNVVLKGGRTISVAIGAKTSAAIGSYLRQRARHPEAHLPWLWIGPRGRLQRLSIADMIAARGKKAGIPGRVRPHRFRHTWAHTWLSAGGSEVGLQRAAGWRNGTMLRRYGAVGADQRSQAEARRLALGDRF